jgi:hypothetical protein
MRTTINIDDDVIDEARAIATRLHRPFRQVVNEALRAGLEAVESTTESKPYRTSPHNMGLKQGRNLDNIQELLTQIEGEDFR